MLRPSTPVRRSFDGDMMERNRLYLTYQVQEGPWGLEGAEPSLAEPSRNAWVLPRVRPRIQRSASRPLPTPGLGGGVREPGDVGLHAFELA